MVLGGKLEQLRVVTDSVDQPLDNSGLEIVVQQNPRTPSQFVQRADVTRQKVLEGLVEEELEVERSRVGKRQHEAAQASRRRSDTDNAEVSPIHLALLAGEHLHTSVNFGAPRSHAPNETTKLCNPSLVSTRSHHVIDPSGAKSPVVF